MCVLPLAERYQQEDRAFGNDLQMEIKHNTRPTTIRQNIGHREASLPLYLVSD